jgi:hypothetical protein
MQFGAWRYLPAEIFWRQETAKWPEEMPAM